MSCWGNHTRLPRPSVCPSSPPRHVSSFQLDLRLSVIPEGGQAGRGGAEIGGKARSPDPYVSRGSPAVNSGPTPPRRAVLAPLVHPPESLPRSYAAVTLSAWPERGRSAPGRGGAGGSPDPRVPPACPPRTRTGTCGGRGRGGPSRRAGNSPPAPPAVSGALRPSPSAAEERLARRSPAGQHAAPSWWHSLSRVVRPARLTDRPAAALLPPALRAARQLRVRPRAPDVRRVGDEAPRCVPARARPGARRRHSGWRWAAISTSSRRTRSRRGPLEGGGDRLRPDPGPDPPGRSPALRLTAGRRGPPQRRQRRPAARAALQGPGPRGRRLRQGRRHDEGRAAGPAPAPPPRQRAPRRCPAGDGRGDGGGVLGLPHRARAGRDRAAAGRPAQAAEEGRGETPRPPSLPASGRSSRSRSFKI